MATTEHILIQAKRQQPDAGSGATPPHSWDGELWVKWIHEIRRIEFEGTMRHVPLGPSARVLELGCGDGFQLSLLRQRFERVVALDPTRRPRETEGFVYAIGESLPFPDKYFDLLISNCVVEHLLDRNRALEEGVRVLKPGGYMAHVVPARYWKATSVLLNPIGYPFRVLEKWLDIRHARRTKRKDMGGDPDRWVRPRMREVIGRWIYPPIHGTYASHFAEFRAYSRKHWVRSFAHPKLSLVSEVPLPCVTQFGLMRYRLIALRYWLGSHGFESSRAFILQRTG
jgi:SAM-dependent methyltransferase